MLYSARLLSLQIWHLAFLACLFERSQAPRKSYSFSSLALRLKWSTKERNWTNLRIRAYVYCLHFASQWGISLSWHWAIAAWFFELILITLEEKSIKSGPDKDSSLLVELSVWEAGLSIRLKSLLSRAVGVDSATEVYAWFLQSLLQNLACACFFFFNYKRSTTDSFEIFCTNLPLKPDLVYTFLSKECQTMFLFSQPQSPMLFRHRISSYFYFSFTVFTHWL